MSIPKRTLEAMPLLGERLVELSGVDLVWHGSLSDVPAGAKRLGVQPVATISEAMTLLERLDDVRKQPSLMRSIKRAFGRDERVD
jgi:hypothetical protein